METNDTGIGKNFKQYTLEGVILDLDGVITQTAVVHREAWKEMFAGYIKDTGIKQSPMSDDDYLDYIDGKPRYEGVKSFLDSRNINLPFGDKNDSAGTETVCGLGNLKNDIFLQLIENKGVVTYDDAIYQIESWRSQGLKCGVVSSSRNCKKILKAAGIEYLFDTRIDGVTLQERNLKGKPAPDMFLDAAKELGAKPENCVIFEDAISGVQAGSRGNFSLVVGISRTGNNKELYENGADIVTDNLKNIDLFSSEIRLFFTSFSPSLFSRLPEFNILIRGRQPMLFLDYDGTLTPIVKNPEDALLPEEMKNVLIAYNSKYPLAIISGRDMDDLRKLVDIDGIIYAGSHGFRISGPGGMYMEHPKSEKILPELDRIENELHNLLDGSFKGVKIERKRYAIAVHYRNAVKDDIPFLKKKVEMLLSQNHGFRKGEGKKIVEVRPDVDWHKGMAIKWIMEQSNLAGINNAVPIYIGDDLTDEDVFETLTENGIGILVGFHGHRTKARYSLKNVYQVRVFIEMLTNNICL